MSASLSALALESAVGPVSLPPEVLAGDGLLHAEVYSMDQLARHARRLAGWHRIDRGRGANPLLARLDENESLLRAVFADLRTSGRGGLVSAGEWLLDNQHLALEQIVTARRHLPRRYSYELPRLNLGDPVGAPRVYALALELISHAAAVRPVPQPSRRWPKPCSDSAYRRPDCRPTMSAGG
jgi:cyclic beta-1,2-glucan synthetase